MISLTTLFSGSSGNCTLIKNGERLALIDAGVSAGMITKSLVSLGLDPSKIEAVFVTHEHIDHVKGLRVFCKKIGNIPVYMSLGTAKGADLTGYEENVVIISENCKTECIGLEFLPFSTPHDARESLGYIICENGEKRIGYATDVGFPRENVVEALKGSEIVLIESNHDKAMLMIGRYPYSLKMRILSDVGHLSNEACDEVIKVLAESGTREFILAHLSKENNIPELALAAAKNYCGTAGVCVAPANTPSKELICLKL